MFVMIRRAVIKKEAVITVQKGYESDVAGPVLDSKGSRFCAVLINHERPLEVRQMTGWESKDDCDRYLQDVYPSVWQQWEWVFDENPVSSFWEMKWPGTFMFNPQDPIGLGMYVRASRFKLTHDGVKEVRDTYDENVIAPVVNSQGNKFIFVLHSTEHERVGSQVTGWETKEACDDYLTNTFPTLVNKKLAHVFEEAPTASFWDIKWPILIKF